MKHLPDVKEIPKLPKQFLINILYTVVGDNFAAWISARIRARNEKLQADKDLNISIDPGLLAAFQNSNAVSSK